MRSLVSSEVTGIFDAEVVVLAAEIDRHALELITEREAELVARAVDKRKHEFATARVLARAAMERIGRKDVELLNAEDRSPIWPEGITGSISHCDTRAVVAVGQRERVGTVGVDIEHRDELKRELWKSVLLKSEIRALESSFSNESRSRMALTIFSAKEALYKAQYPWSTKFMSFHELEVCVLPNHSAPGTGELVCTFQNGVDPFPEGYVARGRYRLDAFAGGEVLTAVRIEPTSPSKKTQR